MLLLPAGDHGLDVGERGLPRGGEVVGDEENRHQEGVLARHGGDRRSLAEQLGISERTLYRKLAG
jgi:transcriptional regulator with PAS, ATPase and Fis domain